MAQQQRERLSWVILATDMSHIFDDIGAVFGEIKESMRGMLYQDPGAPCPP